MYSLTVLGTNSPETKCEWAHASFLGCWGKTVPWLFLVSGSSLQPLYVLWLVVASVQFCLRCPMPFTPRSSLSTSTLLSSHTESSQIRLVPTLLQCDLTFTTYVHNDLLPNKLRQLAARGYSFNITFMGTQFDLQQERILVFSFLE